MENLDVFESAFKRAIREPFVYSRPRFDSVIVLDNGTEDPLCDGVRKWLETHPLFAGAAWICMNSREYEDWAHLKYPLAHRENALIAARRMLEGPDPSNPYSLGATMDAMLQDLPGPVLALPSGGAPDPDRFRLDAVVAVADHLSGHHGLVNHAAAFTLPGGELTLCHVESADVFAHYMNAIERIPEINSALAREKISKQLLAHPRHYIDSVASVLKRERSDLRVDSVVDIGHRIDRYKEILAKRKAGMFVLESKDSSQLAMHSLGYSLAVEFRDIPLLML